MSAYRGTSDDYLNYYFDLNDNTAHIPENIKDKFDIWCHCNDKTIYFKRRDTKNNYSYQFEPNAFDSCKKNKLEIIFFRNSLRKEYTFTISPQQWTDTGTKKVYGRLTRL